jgi:hypothetical protein
MITRIGLATVIDQMEIIIQEEIQSLAPRVIVKEYIMIVRICQQFHKKLV